MGMTIRVRNRFFEVSGAELRGSGGENLRKIATFGEPYLGKSEADECVSWAHMLGQGPDDWMGHTFGCGDESVASSLREVSAKFAIWGPPETCVWVIERPRMEAGARASSTSRPGGRIWRATGMRT